VSGRELRPQTGLPEPVQRTVPEGDDVGDQVQARALSFGSGYLSRTVGSIKARMAQGYSACASISAMSSSDSPK
jgi:hypothetical protein